MPSSRVDFSVLKRWRQQTRHELVSRTILNMDQIVVLAADRAQAERHEIVEWLTHQIGLFLIPRLHVLLSDLNAGEDARNIIKIKAESHDALLRGRKPLRVKPEEPNR